MAERRETVYVPVGKVGLVISRTPQLGKDHGVWIKVDSSQLVLPDPSNGVHSTAKGYYVFHLSSVFFELSTVGTRQRAGEEIKSG